MANTTYYLSTSCIHNTILIRYWTTTQNIVLVVCDVNKSIKKPLWCIIPHGVLYVVCLVLLASYTGLRLYAMCAYIET